VHASLTAVRFAGPRGCGAHEQELATSSCGC
jgi:hypothetical protein